MASGIDKIYKQIDKIVTESNLEVYELEYVKENKIQYLRVYIDTLDDSMISLDDCVVVSNKITEYLDENDPLENEFTLEVTSPGIIRKLSTKRHYEKVIGENIEVKFYKKHDEFESKNVIGKLEQVDDDYIIFEGQKIDYDTIAKAVTVFEF